MTYIEIWRFRENWRLAENTMLNIHVHMRYKYTHRLRLRKSTSKWSGWIIRKYRNSFYYGWSWMKRQHTTISYSFIRTGRVRKQRVWKKKRKGNVLLHLPTICIREYTQVAKLHTQRRYDPVRGWNFFETGSLRCCKIFSTLAQQHPAGKSRKGVQVHDFSVSGRV